MNVVLTRISDAMLYLAFGMEGTTAVLTGRFRTTQEPSDSLAPAAAPSRLSGTLDLPAYSTYFPSLSIKLDRRNEPSANEKFHNSS